MPKQKKIKRKVPPWGRSQTDLDKDMNDGLHTYSSDVPIGNNDPTVVQGVMYGGMPNNSRMARGNLKAWRGKRN